MPACRSWESFIIRLDILRRWRLVRAGLLRIFHYSPWYTYAHPCPWASRVENLSLFALIYLNRRFPWWWKSWESFIIRLDILTLGRFCNWTPLRIFHYSPWYTYCWLTRRAWCVENLSLFALIYLPNPEDRRRTRWESFIIRLDILTKPLAMRQNPLRIFHYSPWYT